MNREVDDMPVAEPPENIASVTPISPRLVDSCIVQLGEISGELEGLSKRAEQQFLAIGGELHGMYLRASEVSKQAAGIFDMVLGEKAEAVRTGLQSLLDRLGEHLRHVLKMADEGNRTLSELLGLLEELPEPLNGYREIAKTLQMLGVSTRIESSGAERAAEGFHLLGTELKNLEQAIEVKVERIMGRLDSLAVLCRNARERVTSIESRRAGLIGEGSELADSVMSAVVEKNQLAAETTRTLSNRSNEITASIGEVVTSLQYQDITRQQIEHVQISLGEISTELGKVATSDNFARGAEVLQVVGEVCRIQAAQLTHSRDELDTAIKRILDGMFDVSGTVTAIAADMQQAAGATERDGGSIFSELEGAVNKISATLNQEIATTREAQGVIGSVLAEATEMSQLVGEIKRIGLEMKIIALNAGINATNVGGGQPSLEVIAQGTQQLSKRVFSQTEALSSGLGELIISSQRLAGAAAGAAEDKTLAQLEGLSQESTELLQSLQQLYAEVVVRLSDMESASRTLAADIGATASAFTIHTDSRRTINDAVTCLAQIAHLVGDSGAVVGGVDDSYLQTLRERFTMQSERDVFNRVQSAEPGGDSPAEDAPVTEHDFGDNVEFF
ncbi:MAG: hypothetical protein C0619_02985 [Desulfuromonas sp.]|nr:MAG: hypothetical protein C0619_02985 [Desulfuromonas sp.]